MLDFVKCLSSLNAVSVTSLKGEPSKGSPMPANPEREEAPIYRPVSITLQVERHRLDLLAKPKDS